MHPKHLNTLEFPKILEQLSKHTLFSASKALALSLQPSTFLAEVHAWQTETTEADHLLSVKPDTTIGGARDVRPLVERSQRGAVLAPAELQDIRQTLIAARDLKRTITRLAENYPRLADMAGRIEECPGVVNEIGQAIDEHGEVKSSASPALARIRREIDIAHGRLMEKLNRLVASSQYQHYLQEALVTQREGRYVVPLKAEFKGKIQGIIHDQSGSGATLFIEPLATVELNNKWRQLQLDEDEEIRRILAALSDLVREQGRFISHTVAALADLDLAFAKAKYAHKLEAVEPILFSPAKPAMNGDASQSQGSAPPPPGFKLMAARHPLLDSKTVVPIDVALAKDTRMLMITGPNTGGKTVSLKTMGLLAVMAQAGLRIPAAEGSALPIFNHVLVDIGDEQSIEQSLSTFSSHMTNIVQILATSDRDSLVILDELGAGTDPIEGSALARAILAYLLEKGTTTMVATHYSELKAFAHTTPGVENASMEFDVDSLAPTYRLRQGLPGASNAFAIAGRLGLSPEIINQARGLVGENAQAVEAMLAEIKSQVEAAAETRWQAEAEREQVKAQNESLNRRLAEIDQERHEILQSARADARREIKAMREELRTLREQARQALQPLSAPTVEAKEAMGEARSQPNVESIETALAKIETGLVAKTPPKPAEKPRSGGPLRPGDQVFIPQFNTIGEVVELQNKQVEVQLGHFRATVPVDEVEFRKRKQPAAEPEKVVATVKVPAAQSPGMELDLRGQIAEEALLRLDQYLDQAFMARLPWVRIIHGKGSGTLRQVVRQALREQPLVSSYRAGETGEGGDGVTVAKLAVN